MIIFFVVQVDVRPAVGGNPDPGILCQEIIIFKEKHCSLHVDLNLVSSFA